MNMLLQSHTMTKMMQNTPQTPSLSAAKGRILNR